MTILRWLIQNFESGDNVWVRPSPIENIWKQGVIIHNVVGVPDSFIIEINCQQYWWIERNKTFSPSRGDDGVVEGATGNQHAEEQDGTDNKTDRLQQRPALKFPELPTQATLHSDFEMLSEIYMYVQVAQCCIDICRPDASWQPQVLFNLIINGDTVWKSDQNSCLIEL